MPNEAQARRRVRLNVVRKRMLRPSHFLCALGVSTAAVLPLAARALQRGGHSAAEPQPKANPVKGEKRDRG